MSSTEERQPKGKADAKGVFGSSNLGDASVEAKEIARLSEEVEQLKDKLGDIIFISAFIIVIIIDLFVFPQFTTWTASIVVGILQFLFLFILARVCRVNDVMVITNLVFDGIEKYKGQSKSSEDN